MTASHSLIVGGSSGIGLATAQELLDLGHRVTIAGRSKQKLVKARSELVGDLGMVELDATDYSGLPAAFSRMGTMDHIVLALGSTKGVGPFASVATAALVPILAAELRSLRVNGVSPGIIRTPWWDFLDAPQREQVFADYAAKTPAGRVGDPRDVAQAIACLVTNTFVTGQILVCDGGLRFA